MENSGGNDGGIRGIPSFHDLPLLVSSPRSDVLSIRVAFVVICVAVVLPSLGWLWQLCPAAANWGISRSSSWGTCPLKSFKLKTIGVSGCQDQLFCHH